MRHLEYLYVISLLVVISVLANVNVENVFSQECEIQSLLSITDCNVDNNNEEAESSDEDDSDSDVPMILPFP